MLPCEGIPKNKDGTHGEKYGIIIAVRKKE